MSLLLSLFLQFYSATSQDLILVIFFDLFRGIFRLVEAGFRSRGRWHLLSNAFLVDHCHASEAKEFLFVEPVRGSGKTCKGVGLL